MVIERMDPASLLDYAKISGLRVGGGVPSETPCPSHAAAWPLRIGAVLVGIGLGIVLGRSLGRIVCVSNDYYAIGEVVVGCVLLCGGLGLLVAFIIEHKLYDKQRD